MKMTSGIKTIMFDMGGVLINLNKQACIDAYKALGYDRVEEFIGNYLQKGPFLDLESGQISPEQFRDAIRREIPRPVTDRQIDDAFIAFLVDMPDYTLDMLLQLKKRYQIFLLSNTNGIIMDYVRRHIFNRQGWSMEHYFDRMFLSYQMGLVKPDPAIFEQVVAETGILPSETLFLDDSSKNTETAEKLGFRAFVVTQGEDFRYIFDEK